VSSALPFETLAHIVSSLTAVDVSGLFISFPYLPRCMCGGETAMVALINGFDAFLTAPFFCQNFAVSPNHLRPFPELERTPTSSEFRLTGLFIML
jgi:hypothetical protein